MEDIHYLSTQFKNLLKETEKIIFDYIDGKILRKSDELLELKAIYGINNMVRLEQCYLAIVHKMIELNCNSKLTNFRQSAQLIYHCKNLYNKATKEGEALYLRIHQKLITTCGPAVDILIPLQHFAFNVRISGDSTNVT